MTFPYYPGTKAVVYNGDCLHILSTLPNASVDAVVTDPPYDLTAGKKGGTGQASVNLDSLYGRSRISTGNGGFMGKDWDATGVAFDPQTWRETMRVLKPGGHLLAFGGSRTWHRLAAAVEDAGFEIRDSIAWLYGSGFPKSLDVSKAIDKARGSGADMDRMRAWINVRRIEAGLSLTEVNDAIGAASNGGGLASAWMTNPTSRALPDWGQWMALKAIIGFGDEMDDEMRRLHEVAAGLDRPVIGARTTGLSVGRGTVPVITAGELVLRGAATETAQQWQGWGTALKPAFEPIVVARKPLVSTVAANVLEHGTGALNIDGCRVVGSAGKDAHWGGKQATGVGYSDEGRTTGWAAATGHQSESHDLPCRVHEIRRCTICGPVVGRWPTNVVLDESQAAELDAQSGITGSNARKNKGTGMGYHGATGERGAAGISDSGGASRFFPVFRYQAKAPAKERPKVDGIAHPTVKPLELMRWLVRLVTPPDGIVLEPFAGSGTTVEAALLEGFHCVAIEREADYLPLIFQRVQRATPGLSEESA